MACCGACGEADEIRETEFASDDFPNVSDSARSAKSSILIAKKWLNFYRNQLLSD